MNVVEKNVRLMLSKSGVLYPESESVGGNAGSEKYMGHKFTCYAMNFSFDCKTGEIFYFSNFDSSDKNCRALFRVIGFIVRGSIPNEKANELENIAYGHILDIGFHNPKKVSKEADAVLMASIEEYNKRKPVQGIEVVSYNVPKKEGLWNRFKSWFS